MSFNKWKDEYGLVFEPNYSKETELDCKAAFKAGQQSQQAKIDAITKQRDSFIKAHHIAMNDVCEHKAKIDELQARVNSLTNINESLVAYKNQLLDELEEKGNKDEN